MNNQDNEKQDVMQNKKDVNSLIEKDVKLEEKVESQDLKSSYDKDQISETSKATKDMEFNRQTRQTEESNKSQSINVDHSELGRYTPSNASKNPSQIHSKNPSLLQKIETEDHNYSDNRNSKTISTGRNLAGYNINSYNNFDNPNLQNINKNLYNVSFSTPKNINNNPNFAGSNIIDDLNKFKIINNPNINSGNLDSNYNSFPSNDYSRRDYNNLRILNYTNPNLVGIPSYLNNCNSFENSLVNSNYNSTPGYLNFNTNSNSKSNEVTVTSLPAMSYHKIPTTPATSGVLDKFIPQYFESTYINPGYNNTSYQTANTDFYGSTTTADNFKQVYDTLSAKVKPPNDFESKEYKETETRDSLKDLIKFDNFSGDYISEAKGKYTNILADKIKSMYFDNDENSDLIKDSDLHFSNDADKTNFCEEHHEVEDYILFEDIEKYKKYDKICKNCLSILKMRKGPGSKVDARLYYEIILDHKDILNAIKTNKININEIIESRSKFKDAHLFLNENILPLADELIDVCNLFMEEINFNLNINFQLEEFKKLKDFIDTMEFEADGFPKLFVTGAEKNKTIYKYISLASFMLNLSNNTMKLFNFGENPNEPIIYQKGISEKLKNLVIKISKLRKFLVSKISLFIKFLLGNFYDFIFSLEGLAPDEDFKCVVQLDYINAEELSRIKSVYDSELQKKDGKLKLLEEENIRIKHELEILRSNFAHFSEQESLIEKLKQDLSKLEEERNTQNVNLNNLQSENERLNKQNNEASARNEMLKNDIQNLKTELESRFRNAFEQLKSEYEKKIIAIGSELNDTRFKLAETEQKYNIDIRNLSQEREGLIAKINSLQQRYEIDMKTLKEQLDGFLRDYNTTQKNLNQQVMQINALNQEKDSTKIALENSKAQISNYENTMQNQSNQIGGLLKEREDLRQQMAMMGNEIDKLRSELSNQVNVRTGLESVLIESRKKGDELINALNAVKTEFANKLTIIPQLESQVRDLNAANGQINSQINGYQNALQRQDNENKELKRIIDEMKIKLYQAAEKDNEITRLKQTIVACRDEWARLSEAYEELLKDIKNQIAINDGLRAFIFELQMKIENHNNQVINLDHAIKQQIENLARQSLQKKVIEYNPNTEVILKSHNEIEAVKSKLGRIEAQKLTQSNIFGGTNNNPSIIQFGQTREYNDFSPQAQMQTVLSQTQPGHVFYNTNPYTAGNIPQSANAGRNIGISLLNTSGGNSNEINNAPNPNTNPNNQKRRSSSESIMNEIEALSKEKSSPKNFPESS